MSFTIDDFLKSVDEINKNNYDYGNDILYSAFNFSKGILPWPQGNIDTRLSSAMSIIGKSYSADPTRSAPEDVFHNNGTGDAFVFLAKGIVAHEEYRKFYDTVEALSFQTFDYNNGDIDKSILINTVFCVALLNKMIRDVVRDVAKAQNKENRESKNTISFCSKFLHFLCPNVFFIKDSISLSKGNIIFKNLGKLSSLSDITICYSNLNYTFCPKEENAIKEYLIHVIRAYSVASFLYNKKKICTAQIASNCQSSAYMPRLVDSIFMNYKI